MNVVTLIGNLATEVEVREVGPDKKVASFVLAIDRASRDGGADFVSVSAWDRQAELCAEYLGKGRRIALDGRLKSRSWEEDGKRRSAIEVVPRRRGDSVRSAGCGGLALERGREIPDRGEAGIRPLADQQVAAPCDRPQWDTQAARVLHPVVEPHPVVARSPEAEAGTGDTVELGSRIRGQERTTRLARVRMVRRPDEKRLGLRGLERVRVGHPPPAERSTAAYARVGPRATVGCDQTPRLRDAEHRQRDAGAACPGADSRRSGEHETTHGFGLQHRGAESDHTSERVPDPHGAAQLLRADDPEHGLGESIDVRCLGEKARAAVAR